ncbi:RAP domain-containing protein [Endozoicomonas acroporae]|uniref:RAP domain-containing protein n=1 Tax=Endozoicomonas acroporae TaxID=1701104 RepID=UPI000C77C511|nr:RAP domain-containing protein [Endozoicomonas acroporae]
MDRSGAGISWKYTTSGNDYKQPDDHAGASGSGQYRYGTVRQVNVPLRYTQKRNEFYPASDACSANHPPGHSIKPVHGFNALITPENKDWLAGGSARYGDRYDGRNHGQFACLIKQYTSGSKRPLNHSEQRQLIPLLHDFKVTPGWSWRSLTTTLHSLTYAGVFTPHKFMNEGDREIQAALLSALLDALILKCNQKTVASDIDIQGIANLLWALAKLADNGLELKKTPKLKEAVTALLPLVQSKAESKVDHFTPQEVANLLWAMAKLVGNGLKLENTPKLKEAVAALLPRAKTKADSKKDQFKPQEFSNLLWAVAKLVDNGLKLEKTPKLKNVVAALLPQVKNKAESKEEKDHLNAQTIANLLWALAKLVDNGLALEKTAQLKEAVVALLPHVKTKAESKQEKDHFIPQHIANLVWAVAKLVDNGLALEKTTKLKEAVAALLHHVKSKAEAKEEKDHFIPQHISNLLWGMAKLVDNGLKLEKTVKLKEAVAALLPHVKSKAESKAEKDHFVPQHIANLLWVMAKLVENGLELENTPRLKEALVALLHHVKINAESKEEKDHFKPQGVSNLLWSFAKLVDNGLELEETPQLKEAVVALLPHVKTKAESKEEKGHFTTQGAINLLWALATLLDNGLVLGQTAKLEEAVPALLYHVKIKVESKEERDDFNTQGTVNLLWALAKLGEAIELNLVQSTFDFLVDRISKNPQLSQQNISMSLWGVMVFSARFYLDSGNNDKNPLEKHIGELFSRLENTCPDSTEVKTVMAMAASWLGKACPVLPDYQISISELQSTFRDQLQSSLPLLKIEEEKSLNSLPPVDLRLPDYNMVIDVQGPFHYVSGDFKTRNGSTLLKITLLQKLGFEVVEIPVNKLNNLDSMKIVIEQIKTKLAVLPEAHDSVSPDREEEAADEVYFTANEDGQCSDDCYFTAEECLEEKTGKPKRKRKRKKSVKTHLLKQQLHRS